VKRMIELRKCHRVAGTFAERKAFAAKLAESRRERRQEEKRGWDSL
jgi:hypothetical protein